MLSNYDVRYERIEHIIHSSYELGQTRIYNEYKKFHFDTVYK